MKRSACERLDDDELGDDLEPKTQKSAVRQADLLKLVHGLSGGTSEVLLVQQTASLQAQLQSAQERLESLERQRMWLWGGLGVSAVVLLLVGTRRRRPPTSPPQQLAGARAPA